MTTINSPIPTTTVPETQSLGNYLGFAQALLQQLNLPNTPDNQAALVTWMNAEQGGQPNAAFNPLNIQAGDFPHTSLSSGGQYNFASWEDGVAQTAAFLQQGAYSGILAALQAGNNAANVLGAIQDSPWASGHYNYQLVGDLANTLANFGSVANGQIAGATAEGAPQTISILGDLGNAAGQFAQNPLGPLDPLNIIGGVGSAISSAGKVEAIGANVLTEVFKAVKYLVDPHNWVRIGMFVGGGLLILFAFGIIDRDTISRVGKTAAELGAVAG